MLINTWPTLCNAFRSFSDLSYCFVSSFSCSRTAAECHRQPTLIKQEHHFHLVALNTDNYQKQQKNYQLFLELFS